MAKDNVKGLLEKAIDAAQKAFVEVSGLTLTPQQEAAYRQSIREYEAVIQENGLENVANKILET